jgi:hypothetical protein
MTKRPAVSRLSAALPALLLLSALLPASASAEEIIRYKPVVVQHGDNNLAAPKVLIVDTKDGHVWLWQERLRKETPESGPEAQIIYQGRLAPGRAPGDAVASVKGRR